MRPPAEFEPARSESVTNSQSRLTFSPNAPTLLLLPQTTIRALSAGDPDTRPPVCTSDPKARLCSALRHASAAQA